MSLSVAIITKDEEQDLPGCIESVSFADEIVVVDAMSTDRTREVAAAAGAKVLTNPWPGFGAQKAFALSNTSCDWVLSLDADERCSPALREALPQAMASQDLNGYLVRFETWMFGRRVRYGGFQSERHLRLFRRNRANFSSAPVHEGARVDGKVGILDAPIRHFTYASLSEYLDKINRYTSSLALEKHRSGKKFSKLSILRLPWGFFRRYVLRLGFLDGYDGFLFALMSGLYDMLKYAKLRDLSAVVEVDDGPCEQASSSRTESCPKRLGRAP